MEHEIILENKTVTLSWNLCKIYYLVGFPSEVVANVSLTTISSGSALNPGLDGYTSGTSVYVPVCGGMYVRKCWLNTEPARNEEFIHHGRTAKTCARVKLSKEFPFGFRKVRRDSWTQQLQQRQLVRALMRGKGAFVKLLAVVLRTDNRMHGSEMTEKRMKRFHLLCSSYIYW